MSEKKTFSLRELRVLLLGLAVARYGHSGRAGCNGSAETAQDIQVPRAPPPGNSIRWCRGAFAALDRCICKKDVGCCAVLYRPVLASLLVCSAFLP